ncbi:MULTISPECIES: 4-hydroxyphenyl-beta-ketoacyl-CoA hydrolase [Brevibacterium]|uniref:4-hydroxyphenyl-beta-ketoacyl-CoA hydrolase n=1 Tax=Brevibacterium aurantiacum TaxID=273384 RepID=A0A1D7W2C4_BREAU|nr:MULTISPECIES: 4-hydroxyphenyl-beta-ketoacyl-CoA hydrolase [Brevibacterium]AOP53112.1 putative ANTIBIOTIC-RESISTANCE PROTEIN [Brevibacterium aurantiacum]MDN5594369.1 4-hydroxyphenyl-beta-ketoacyl-CoA hydrolase [Brevibacterium sp.]MDN5607116.1 4-hydroxyphenyl-beta-ketoacyl-CoA hydrolase [Brevibacterium sp.]MDN5658122.1 4-hydroxyphenyl-beta-ketoacyl-CoA hydrolase [Brevibacterium sandarakinum]MDN5660807.1 4-hydroxyphenyl-beta-ketoacyl-CoA hydrolase [Brevibacterium aurantiacum]
MIYQPNIDLSKITAIDVHTHVEADAHQHTSLDRELLDASAGYFKAPVPRTPTVDDLAAYYRERNMAAVIFTVDARTALGDHPPVSSEMIAEKAAEHNDVLIPFGSVDPLNTAEAIARVHDLATNYGVRGMKFHPSLQGFDPSDRTYYPIYEACAEHGLVTLFHTGQTGIGAGLPGGRGIKLRYSDPMLLDDVAADFPTLTMILAHPSVPWADASISIATHKSNVFIDLSGWSPKYFPPQLTRAIGSMLKTKTLFGSDFPLITPERWIKDFEELGIKEEAVPLIMKDTAVRVLGL